LIDLRLVCDEASVAGGEKIVGAIIKLLAENEFKRRRTEVFI
jgi:hypothetical protein